MNKLDTRGVYRGPIVDSAVGISKSGYPKWVATLKADEKWIEDPSELEHFELEAPAWVDWSEFSEQIIVHLVLFTANVEQGEHCTEENQLLNYDQLQRATGWAGDSFDELQDGSVEGKSILFRVEDNDPDFAAKNPVTVEWIDAFDASPTTNLTKLDSDKLSALNALLKGGGSKKPGKAARPAKPAGQGQVRGEIRGEGRGEGRQAEGQGQGQIVRPAEEVRGGA